MSPKVIELRRSAADKYELAKTVVETAEKHERSMSSGEVEKYDRLVAEGDRLRTQAEAQEASEPQGDAFDINKLTDAAFREAGMMSGGSPRRAAKVGAAPSLFLSRGQVEELHGAYVSRAVTSVTAPQSAKTDYKSDVGGTYPVLRDAFRIMDLIPVEATDRATVTYYRGANAASNARVVGEGGTKPESDPSYTAVVESVRKIAHYVSVTDEALADESSFADMLEAEALMGLLNEENTQIIAGTGAAVAGTGGTQFTGLLNQSGIVTYAPAAAEPRFDSLVIASEMLMTGSSFTTPTSVIINPVDHRKLVLSKTSGSGEYLVNDMLNMLPTMYVTNRIPAGTALVSNLEQAARIYSRMAPTVKVDPFSQSTSNRTLVFVEERFALAVPRPSAIARVTFSGNG